MGHCSSVDVVPLAYFDAARIGKAGEEAGNQIPEFRLQASSIPHPKNWEKCTYQP